MSAMPGFTAKLHGEPAAFGRLRGEWNALWEAGGSPSPFTHPAWLEAWWLTYGQGRKLAIAEVRAGDELAMIAPLQVSRLPPLGARRLELLGGGPATARDWLRDPRGLGLASANDVLVAPGQGQLAVVALAACLAGLAPTLDAVRLAAVPAASPLLALPEHLESGWRVRVQARPPHRHRIDLGGGWEEFRAGLSKRQRKDLGYKVNELARAAGNELSVRRCEGSGVAEALDRFVDLHLRRWHARGKPGLLPGEDRFYRQLVAARAPLVAYKLTSGERLLASQFGLEGRRSYAPFNFAFDPAFGEQSPSHVLMQLVIQECCARGFQSVEMVPWAMAQHWRPRPIEMRHLLLSPARPAARLSAGLTRALESVVEGAQANAAGRRARSRAAAVAALLGQRRR